jgi:hypothetical protein
MERFSNFKLRSDLIPRSSRYINLKNLAKPYQWDIIRREAYKNSNHVCGLCGKEGRLECHEQWEFDDINHIQKLIGTIALCNYCHSIKHLGFMAVNKSNEDIVKITNHFMQINHCSKKEFDTYVSYTFSQWGERSKFQWTIDWNEYKEYINDSIT